MTIHRLSVMQHRRVTPNMIRVVLTGASLQDFPTGQESGYVKLVLPQGDKVRMRSYTIRAFDLSSLQLTLDFVDHGETGPASRWANRAQLGSVIDIRGPGPAKLIAPSDSWYILAGDMTALPAISVNLEKLPSDACGYAVIEVVSEADIQPLKHPAGIEIHWVINANMTQMNTVLADKVVSLPWLAGTPSVWVACEFDAMRKVRHYVRELKQVPKQRIYASSYWKINASDEENKAAKQADLQA